MSEPACKLIVDKALCNKTRLNFMTEKIRYEFATEETETELTNAREDFLHYYLKSY